jgi:hypothetical protein
MGMHLVVLRKTVTVLLISDDAPLYVTTLHLDHALRYNITILDSKIPVERECFSFQEA